MKKFTFIAAAALTALAAQAQYNVNPSTSEVTKNGVSEVVYIALSDGAINDFKTAGAKVEYAGPAAELGRNLWYWNGFNAGDESYPRVDLEEGGYISVAVQAGATWSGAGVAVDNKDFAGLDLSSFSDDTHFHMAYMTPSANGPASICFILLDDADNGSTPAKFALGTSFNDDGTIIPTIGETISDDWNGIDITFKDLKRVWPSFNLQNNANWGGNIFSWLGGSVAGQTMAFDAVYFYNAGEVNGVDSVEAKAQFIVTDNTVNVAGANGIELYNMAGQLVKSTAGTTLGLTNLVQGVYVAKSGNAVRKIVVR